MKFHPITIFFTLLLADVADAPALTLPRQEQLSAQHVTHLLQDSEGYLWYATKGGGVCRDDGRQMLVMRSDAERPDLLPSNDVACLAEADASHILIGTYHGACVLDKRDYSIRRLPEVDDRRVDDILIGSNGHWWLTSNKKIYEFMADGTPANTYPVGDKYIFRLREDSLRQIWATEWEGGQWRLEGRRFVQVTDEWPDSIDFSRITTDRQGRQLVADGFGKIRVAGSTDGQGPWFKGQILTKSIADGLRNSLHLSTRPTAIATDRTGTLWFSTGKDIRRYREGSEEVVLADVKDVSAMAFSADGTLWLATIFGTVMTYRDGRLATDTYASNEHGDAVTALQADSTTGRLLIVGRRYARIYDPARQTLRQQSIEADGVYRVELAETAPGQRWSQPQPDTSAARMPLWSVCLVALLLVALAALLADVARLRRQRRRFLAAMRADAEPCIGHETRNDEPAPTEMADEWLQKAIALVESNLGDVAYSVEQLSRDLCMSRMTCYRRIQEKTGQSPSEFIRTIRLRCAAELLREGKMNVSEVSYATGFSSISYFSRSFRAMYGMPPTLFGHKTHKKEHLP